jgi:ACT domain-containing protein
MATLQFLEKVNNSLENFSKLDILTKTSITKVCQEIGISRQVFYQFVEYVEELKK